MDAFSPDGSVVIYSLPPKVGDTIRVLIHDEDGNEVNPADVDAEIQWYLAGKAVEGATKSSFTIPTSAQIGDKVKVVVTDVEGNTFESDEATVSKKSEQEVAAEITIADRWGLQTDGKGLIGDPIDLSYGSEVGTPTSITWYRDSKIVATYTSQATQYVINGALTCGNGTIAGQSGKVGKYWAVITTGDGDTIKSNEIELTDEEKPAIIKSFTITDDYEHGVTGTTGADRISYKAKDCQAVATLVMNRDYAGTLQIFAKDDTKFQTAMGGATAAGAQKSTGEATSNTAGKFVVADSMNQMKADKLNSAAPANTTAEALKYINDDTGEATYMWIIDSTNAEADVPVRGKDYIAVFDQTALSSDDLGKGAENKSAAATVPYVTAPSSIKVSSFTNSTDTEITLCDASGNALKWFDQTAAAPLVQGFESNDLYNITSTTVAATDTKATVTAAKALKGVVTLTTSAALTDLYVYAKFKTTAGIYGKDAVELTSAVGEGAQAAASSVVLTENSTTATSADIAFSQFKSGASGKVTIYRAAASDATHDANTIVANGTVVATVEVEGGKDKITVPNVFPAITGSNDDYYLAVLSPTDTKNFKAVNSRDSGDNAEGTPTHLTQVAKTYSLTGSGKLKGDGTNVLAANGTATKMTVKDQFGTTLTSTTAVTLATAIDKFGLDAAAKSMEPTTTQAKDMVGTAPTIKVSGSTGTAGDIAIAFDIATTDRFAKGLAWTYETTLGTFTLTSTADLTVAPTADQVPATQTFTLAFTAK